MLVESGAGADTACVLGAGQGRLLKCLRDHKADLSAECAAEDTKLAILQSQDIRLTPRLHQMCSGEVAAFCKEVKPGKHGHPTLGRQPFTYTRFRMSSGACKSSSA